MTLYNQYANCLKAIEQLNSLTREPYLSSEERGELIAAGSVYEARKSSIAAAGYTWATLPADAKNDRWPKDTPDTLDSTTPELTRLGVAPGEPLLADDIRFLPAVNNILKAHPAQVAIVIDSVSVDEFLEGAPPHMPFTMVLKGLVDGRDVPDEQTVRYSDSATDREPQAVSGKVIVSLPRGNWSTLQVAAYGHHLNTIEGGYQNTDFHPSAFPSAFWTKHPDKVYIDGNQGGGWKGRHGGTVIWHLEPVDVLSPTVIPALKQ